MKARLQSIISAFILGTLFNEVQEIHTQNNATSSGGDGNQVNGWTYGNTSFTVETNDVYYAQKGR